MSAAQDLYRVKTRKIFVFLWSIVSLFFLSAASYANIISVPFREGFVGTLGSSNRAATNVLRFSTLGISSSVVQQNSSTNVFESPTGNDIPVTLILNSGIDTLAIPGNISWKIKQGNDLQVFGFTPSASATGFQTYSISYGSGQTLTLDATSNYGLVRPPHTLASVGITDGSNQTGSNDPVTVSELNAYLTQVQASRPYGPITVNTQTVTLSGGNTTATPTLTGEACLVTAVTDTNANSVETITVVVDGKIYSPVSYTIQSGSTFANGTTTCPTQSGVTNSYVIWSLPTTYSISAGVYDVTARITSTVPVYNQISDATLNELTIVGSTPLLSLSKTLPVLTAMSDGADVGDQLQYTITAKNIGAVPVTIDSMTDQMTTVTGSTSTAVATPGTLSSRACSGGDGVNDASFSPNEICVWTYTYTLVAGDLSADKVQNLATLSYTSGGTTYYLESDASGSGNQTTGSLTGGTTYSGTATSRDILLRQLTATKTASPPFDVNVDGRLSAGDRVDFQITLQNTGDVEYNSVQLTTDSLTRGTTGAGAALTLSSGPTTTDNSSDTTLSVSEIWTYTATYTLTQADIDDGGVSNIATFSATPINSSTAEIIRTSSSGNTAPGPSGGGVTTALLTAAPSMSITKTAVTSGLSTPVAVNNIMSWTVSAINTGNVTLSSVTLGDSLRAGTTYTLPNSALTTSRSGSNSADTSFDPGDTWTWAINYTLTQADIDAGSLENVASVTATPPGTSVTPITVYSGANNTASTSGSAPSAGGGVTTALTAAPQLTITKTVNDSALASGVRVGALLTYTITVANSGNVSLTNVMLYDDGTHGSGLTDANGGGLSLTSGPTRTAPLSGTTLGVGESWTYTAQFALTQAAITAGGVNNIATVTATPPSGSAIFAQSKLAGNTSAGGAGSPTSTGFPGEISGEVKEYLAGVSGVTVYLLQETSSGSGTYNYVYDSNHHRITTTTGSSGGYVFGGLPAGNYGVEFLDPRRASNPSAASADATATGNRIEGITVSAGAVKIEQDAFFIDPSGVVYDSETFAPISGATVTLLYNGQAVRDSWLNTTLGNPNGSLTDANGRYTYVLNPALAQSGSYSLLVERSRYRMSSKVPAAVGSYVPQLGGGIEEIVVDTTSSQAMQQRYYLSFSFVFDPNSAANTSNGVVNNHIPMDLVLSEDIRDELVDILKEDLAATMTQQADRMSGFAKDALDRLKSRDGEDCLAAATDELRKEPLHFLTASAEIAEDSNAVLDRVAEVLKACPDTRLTVAGHTDSDGDEDYNLSLSQARAESVAAALAQRGVVAGRMEKHGYGETQPIADETTAAGKAQNRRVEFVMIEGEQGLAPCEDTRTANRDFTASTNDEGFNVDGTYQSERQDCATDSWHIVDAAASYLTTGQNLDQGMLTMSLRRERFTNDNSVRGRFLGVYASNSAISGTAEGDVRGLGLNGGLYGANRTRNGMFLDYYLGVAGGLHNFDLSFARTVGTINAIGNYNYVAGFAGVALSGESHKWGKTLAPRMGIDLAWSPGGSGAVTAARGLISDSSDLTIPSVSGARIFAEMGIGDLFVSQGSAATFTPRVLCAQLIGASTVECGYGAAFEWGHVVNAEGVSWSVALDGEHVGTSTMASLSAQYSIPLGAGELSGDWLLGSAGDVGLQSTFALKF